jgi:hypothetical protein
MRWVEELPKELWEGITAHAAVAIPFFGLVAIAVVLLYAAHRPTPDEHRPAALDRDHPSVWLPPKPTQPSRRSSRH